MQRIFEKSGRSVCRPPAHGTPGRRQVFGGLEKGWCSSERLEEAIADRRKFGITLSGGRDGFTLMLIPMRPSPRQILIRYFNLTDEEVAWRVSIELGKPALPTGCRYAFIFGVPYQMLRI
ncbi:hypothetical protein [Massilia scottii]|uniref:hypothetical protein n=1 Tax=Massilia scottii TaxID=3057166 RepID=UPI0027966FA8|nr:hypothetical protein [Massilia sp. CCM 9029]MDQ1830915.1 hypothetical protein [Massilia sp. CCM 9029]